MGNFFSELASGFDREMTEAEEREQKQPVAAIADADKSWLLVQEFRQCKRRLAWKREAFETQRNMLADGISRLQFLEVYATPSPSSVLASKKWLSIARVFDI